MKNRTLALYLFTILGTYGCVSKRETAAAIDMSVGDTIQIPESFAVYECNVSVSTWQMWVSSGGSKQHCIRPLATISGEEDVIDEAEAGSVFHVEKILHEEGIDSQIDLIFLRSQASGQALVAYHFHLEKINKIKKKSLPTP